MKALLNYRYYAIVLLSTVAVFLIWCDVDNSIPHYWWIYCIISSKLLGLLLMWFISRLIKRWERRGVIPELSNAKHNY